MGQHLFLRKGLLDQQKVECVELGEMLRIRDRVSRVGVDLERHVSKSFANSAYGFQVPPGLDLQLDAAVALVEVVTDRLQHLRDGSVDADRDAAVNSRADRAQVPAEGFARRAQLCVQQRHLDRRFCHLMTVHGPQHLRHVFRGERRALQQPRHKVVDEHVLSPVDVLGGIGRILTSNALAPAFAFTCDRLQDQDVPLALDPERSLERSHER